MNCLRCFISLFFESKANQLVDRKVEIFRRWLYIFFGIDNQMIELEPLL